MRSLEGQRLELQASIEKVPDHSEKVSLESTFCGPIITEAPRCRPGSADGVGAGNVSAAPSV